MDINNIYDLASQLNLHPAETLFFEAFPIDENTCVVRFADRVNSIRVYYKIERFPMIVGGIIMWHGLLANIPPEYALCDGTNGTPDLRDKFIVGSANGVDPGGGGGSINHNHTYTGDGHQHSMGDGGYIQPGTGYHKFTMVGTATGTTDNEDGRPPFYEIAYIMKL